jgi:hypothetical protein
MPYWVDERVWVRIRGGKNPISDFPVLGFFKKPQKTSKNLGPLKSLANPSFYIVIKSELRLRPFLY